MTNYLQIYKNVFGYDYKQENVSEDVLSLEQELEDLLNELNQD